MKWLDSLGLRWGEILREILLSPEVFGSLVFAVAGWLVAWGLERRALEQLAIDEAPFAHIRLQSDAPEELRGTAGALIHANVALTHDFFRTFLISIRKLFGGRVEAYQRLVDRGRRIAYLRLREEAAARHAEAVLNVRVETVNLSRHLPRIEVVAWGTAVTARPPPA